MLKASENVQIRVEVRNNCTNKIEKIIADYRNTTRLDKSTDILRHWENNKIKMPELYQLSKIAHAIPMTQVSVELLFSGLRFIWSDLRERREISIIEDTMLLRCNSMPKKEKEFSWNKKKLPASQ